MTPDHIFEHMPAWEPGPTIEERMQNAHGGLTTAEREYIDAMRRAAALGVGYGFMQQVTEWEWQHVGPGSWGPEYHVRDIRRLEAELEAARESLSESVDTAHAHYQPQIDESIRENNELRAYAEAAAAEVEFLCQQLEVIGYRKGAALSRDRVAAAKRSHEIGTGNPKPVGRCATTQTERYRVEGCTCPTYPGNEGLPCLTWSQSRAADRCAYCDHNLECHRRLSAMFKGGHAVRQDSVRAAAERMVRTYRDWMAGCDNGAKTKDVQAAHINLRDALNRENSQVPKQEPLVAVVSAFGAAHLWEPCEAPHAALRSDAYVRSRCGQVARRDDLLNVLNSDTHRCRKCHAQDSRK